MLQVVCSLNNQLNANQCIDKHSKKKDSQLINATSNRNNVILIDEAMHENQQDWIHFDFDKVDSSMYLWVSA